MQGRSNWLAFYYSLSYRKRPSSTWFLFPRLVFAFVLLKYPPTQWIVQRGQPGIYKRPAGIFDHSVDMGSSADAHCKI